MDKNEDSPSTSSTSIASTGAKPRCAIKDFVKQRRQIQNQPTSEPPPVEFIEDDYANVRSCDEHIRRETGIIYHDDMAKHKCDWDPNYPENPERYIAVMERLKELGLIDRCTIIDNEKLPEAQEILFEIHNPIHVELLETYCKMSCEFRENISRKFDSIYINEHTYNCANLAYKATISLLKSIYQGTVSNGIAIVRPPGHHAQHSQFNGYCFFNNVAVGVRYLLDAIDPDQRILIVDFDVHHGQGTQQMFLGSETVLYFSIHRYEHGEFWPNLRESNFDKVGTGRGKGYNINVPLNTTGLSDSDYMAIILQILLPVAYEFQPDLVIFSAGYDACVGCPEGQMNVTPGFYFHLIKLLSGLAGGKLAVILEGGYFLPSLAEGVAMTLRGLLDDRSIPLAPIKEPHDTVKEVINNLKYVLHSYWHCFSIIDLHPNKPIDSDEPLHEVIIMYNGKEGTVPFETRDCYPLHNELVAKKFSAIVDGLKQQYGAPIKNTVCYAYSEDMLLHKSNYDSVENPQRLSEVFKQFKELNLDTRCVIVVREEINAINLARKVHSETYIDTILNKDFTLDGKSGDMYWDHETSVKSVTAALKALISVVDAVMTKQYSSGVALIRPPGHHAEFDKYLGFCFINNVAVAAQYLRDTYKLKRIMIIDIDIHHGNGTQNIFYGTNEVFYVSIHKYEQGSYFPGLSEASAANTGEGEGRGYNMNIPFDRIKLSEIDYLYTFFSVLLPVAYSYSPEFIFISAGFDAGINDLLGTYKVFPEGFAHMVQLLRGVSGGRLVLAMEGGYNITTLKHSLAVCTKALLGDPIPRVKVQKISPDTRKVVEEVIKHHKEHWPALAIDKPLPCYFKDLTL